MTKKLDRYSGRVTIRDPQGNTVGTGHCELHLEPNYQRTMTWGETSVVEDLGHSYVELSGVELYSNHSTFQLLLEALTLVTTDGHQIKVILEDEIAPGRWHVTYLDEDEG